MASWRAGYAGAGESAASQVASAACSSECVENPAEGRKWTKNSRQQDDSQNFSSSINAVSTSICSLCTVLLQRNEMASALPATFRRMRVKELTTVFRDAVEIVSQPMAQPDPGQLVVRNRFVGINASDVNFTAGRYNPGQKPPFFIGFESCGEVVSTGGGDCSGVSVGDKVAFMENGSFSEYSLVPANRCFRVPSLDSKYVPLLVSGLTASISLEEVGELKEGQTVLVTAAAGGTGQFAVQLAKSMGCHVVGTCSTDEKVAFLKSIGCDRAVNYKKEDLKRVLHSEYPGGFDCIYESVGGNMFDTCVKALGTHGKLIIIGFITGYKDDLGFPLARYATLPAQLLRKSASVRGFFLFNHMQSCGKHFVRLAKMYGSGKLVSCVDDGGNGRAPSGPFRGLESIADAVDYLYTGKSFGKVIVDLGDVRSSLWRANAYTVTIFHTLFPRSLFLCHVNSHWSILSWTLIRKKIILAQL